MYNLDSLSLKYLIEENTEFLTGAVVQKIQMPSKREILLSLRNLGENRRLYINVDPKFAHMNFITDKENYSIKIPKEPPMFCMLLRKHMEGAKFQAVRAVEYERIVEFYFEIYDEIGSAVRMCLSVEFMGKHSNAILYNASNKVIAGCVHNISPEKSSVREVWGGISYIYPPKQEKTDILKTSFAGFAGVCGGLSGFDAGSAQDMNGLADENAFVDKVSGHYYYFSKGFLNFLLGHVPKSLEERFSLLQNAASGDFSAVKEFWAQNILDEGILGVDESGTNASKNTSKEAFGRVSFGTGVQNPSLNFLIEKYFSHFVLKDLTGAKKAHLKRLLGKEYKRCQDIVLNSGKKTSHELQRKKGELLLAHMYELQDTGETPEKVLFEGVEIALDTSKTLSENAQRYFALYQKGKTASEIQAVREKEAKANLEYLDSILFSIENARAADVLDEIEDELNEFLAREKGVARLSHNTSYNASHNTSNGAGASYSASNGTARGVTSKKKEKPAKIQVQSVEYKGFEIFIGKNNKQNDYLIKKVSNPEDIWLHGKDCPSSHCFIKTENGKKAVPDEVLLFACNLVKENSPMKNSAKASIIYTKRKFIKRPPDTHLGYVTYREEKEIVV